jgi:hypothetical protein
MNKRSSPDAKVKQQHTLVEFKRLSSTLDTAMEVVVPFIRLSNLRFNGIFEV